MAEDVIKRTNFFDGQFLKQGDFLGLESYHRHMRRRLLHMLFDQTGVVQLNSTDLRVVISDAAQKIITVNAGTALSKRDGDIVEAKEVVLRENRVIDLDTVVPALVNGDQAVVTVHYAEQPTDSSSEGGVAGFTRVTEEAVVTVHKNALPATTAPNGEPYIRLGDVNYQFMTAPDETARREARLRPGLIGGIVGPGPTPVITAISPASGNTGAVNLAVHVTGVNLAGATGITFPAASGIAQVGALSAVTTTGFDAVLNIAAGGTPAAYQFIVALPGGVNVSSNAVQFTVGVQVTVTGVAPTIISIQNAAPSGTLTVTGQNLHAAGLAPGAPAVGTVVRLVRQSDPTQVLATCGPAEVVNVGGGNQRIRCPLPLAAGFAVQTSPARVRVEFGGGSGLGAQNLTLNF